MKSFSSFFLFLVLSLGAAAQTLNKNVQKAADGTNAITESLVFGNGKTLTATGTGAITATAAPLSGLTGLGSGVGAALAINTGSAGAPVLFNGALGTPSSGTVTNLTGTASININGTVGATTPAAGTFTTLAFASSATNVADFTGLSKAGTSTTAASALFTSVGVSGKTFFGDSIAILGAVTTSGSGSNIIAGNGFLQAIASTATYHIKIGSGLITGGQGILITSPVGETTDNFQFNNAGGAWTTGGGYVFKTDGVAKFSITKDGNIANAGTLISTGLVTAGAGLTVTGTAILATTSTPASAGATGTTGTITWDSSYIYICVSTNTWKRVAIATW